jgi:tetratricopeptide (TPR) repeat protein
MVLAQNERIERAKIYFKSESDAKVAAALNDSSFNIRFNEPEVALQFARAAFVFSEKEKDEHPKAHSLFNIATAFHIMGTYDSAMHYYQMADKLFTQFNEPKPIGTIYLQVGLLFGDSGDKKKAIEYTHKAIKYFGMAKDTINLVAAYSNLGTFYNNLDTVLDYHIKALNLLKQQVNVERKQKALSLSISYTNIGNTYQQMKKLNEAIFYYKLALEEDDIHGNLLYKIASYDNLGSCYIFMHEPRKAIATLLRAIRDASASRGYRTTHILYRNLALAYKEGRIFDSAYYYMDTYALMLDSITNSENQKIFADMRQKYDNDKKETEIALLNKDKEASATFRKTLYVIIGLILIVVMALIYSYVQKRRSNKDLVLKNEEINKQKKIIEEKQKEIIDSIHYARRIQQSLMPTSKYIDKKLDDLKH